MLADSELKEECYHSLNWVMAGKANQSKQGGVKWASSPHVRMKGHWSTTSMQNAPTYQEVPTPIKEGWHSTLQSSQAKMTEHEVVLLERKGGYIETPKKYPTF